jgi:hypothetical protein
VPGAAEDVVREADIGLHRAISSGGAGSSA